MPFEIKDALLLNTLNQEIDEILIEIQTKKCLLSYYESSILQTFTDVKMVRTHKDYLEGMKQALKAYSKTRDRLQTLKDEEGVNQY